MAGYLRRANANLGGAFETSRRSDELVEEAHEAAARFLGGSPEEVGFGSEYDDGELPKAPLQKIPVIAGF